MERTRGLSRNKGLYPSKEMQRQPGNLRTTRTHKELRAMCSVFMHICWHGGYAMALRCLSKIAPRLVLGTIRCNNNISPRSAICRRRRFLICTTPPCHWTAVAGRSAFRSPLNQSESEREWMPLTRSSARERERRHFATISDGRTQNGGCGREGPRS